MFWTAVGIPGDVRLIDMLREGGRVWSRRYKNILIKDSHGLEDIKTS